jgi:hypothetical protein
MPNFDGTGPLHRGRSIGRGLGPCDQDARRISYKRKTEKNASSDSPGGEKPGSVNIP